MSGLDSEDESRDRSVYQVTHCAFRSEFVVASSHEEATDAAAGGWDAGDYVYGNVEPGDEVCHVARLSEMPQIGETTVQRLLNADSPVPLGPSADPDTIQKGDVTRLRNRLEDPRTRPSRY